jgi:hypothetical protein
VLRVNLLTRDGPLVFERKINRNTYSAICNTN